MTTTTPTPIQLDETTLATFGEAERTLLRAAADLGLVTGIGKLNAPDHITRREKIVLACSTLTGVPSTLRIGRKARSKNLPERLGNLVVFLLSAIHTLPETPPKWPTIEKVPGVVGEATSTEILYVADLPKLACYGDSPAMALRAVLLKLEDLGHNLHVPEPRPPESAKPSTPAEAAERVKAKRAARRKASQPDPVTTPELDELDELDARTIPTEPAPPAEPEVSADEDRIDWATITSRGADEWATGPDSPFVAALAEGGPGMYTHMIRAKGDPQRSTRESKAPEERGNATKRALKDRLLSGVDVLRNDVIALFERDPAPKTFNAISVLLLDRTADITGHDDNPFCGAIRELVKDGVLEHTMHSPILFRPAAREAHVMEPIDVGNWFGHACRVEVRPSHVQPDGFLVLVTSHEGRGIVTGLGEASYVDPKAAVKDARKFARTLKRGGAAANKLLSPSLPL